VSVGKLTVDILRVFVDARHHIPRHRCLPLFRLLIEKLDADVSLACTCLLIVESSVRTKHLPQATAEMETDTAVNPIVIVCISADFLFCVYTNNDVHLISPMCVVMSKSVSFGSTVFADFQLL